jgi:hypothetical protein
LPEVLFYLTGGLCGSTYLQKKRLVAQTRAEVCYSPLDVMPEQSAALAAAESA